MTEGELRCIGVSADLKSRFGEGYKLSVQVAKNGNQDTVDQFIKQIAPNAVLLNSLSGTKENYTYLKLCNCSIKPFQEPEAIKYQKELLHWIRYFPALKAKKQNSI